MYQHWSPAISIRSRAAVLFGIALSTLALTFVLAYPRGNPATAGEPTPAHAAGRVWAAPAVFVLGYTPTPEGVQVVLAIENRNTDVAAGDVVFEVAALDQEGNWLGFGQSQVWLLAPGERTSTIFTVQLADQRDVQRVVARLRTWQALPLQPLAVTDAELVPSDPPRAVAVVRSPLPAPVANVRVSAVGYDEDGSVAGSGVTFLAVLAGGEERRVEVPLAVDRPPARVEVFAVLTSRSTQR